MHQIFLVLIRLLGRVSDGHRTTKSQIDTVVCFLEHYCGISAAHLSDARHLGVSQAFLIVPRTSSSDRDGVSPAPAVDRKHRLSVLQDGRHG